MWTRFKQWRCGRRDYKNIFGKGHGPLRKDKLVGARYQFTCTRCGKVVHTETNMDKNYGRQR